MATLTKVQTASATLTTTTADTVKLTGLWDYLYISNLDASTALTVTQDGTTATAGKDGAQMVPPGQTLKFRATLQGNGVVGSSTTPPHLLSVVGNGNAYIIQGIPATR